MNLEGKKLTKEDIDTLLTIKAIELRYYPYGMKRRFIEEEILELEKLKKRAK